jgi:hypothetical protein
MIGKKVGLDGEPPVFEPGLALDRGIRPVLVVRNLLSEQQDFFSPLFADLSDFDIPLEMVAVVIAGKMPGRLDLDGSMPSCLSTFSVVISSTFGGTTDGIRRWERKYQMITRTTAARVRATLTLRILVRGIFIESLPLFPDVFNGEAELFFPQEGGGLQGIDEADDRTFPDLGRVFSLVPTQGFERLPVLPGQKFEMSVLDELRRAGDFHVPAEQDGFRVAHSEGRQAEEMLDE